MLCGGSREFGTACTDRRGCLRCGPRRRTLAVSKRFSFHSGVERVIGGGGEFGGSVVLSHFPNGPEAEFEPRPTAIESGLF